MAMRAASTLVALALAALAPSALGHGYLSEPPARNSGRGPPNGYCPQCGNGRGVCGDGGQFGSQSNFLAAGGAPQRTYTAGEVVDFRMEITANHGGHFKVYVCDQQIGPQTPDPEGPSGCLSRWEVENPSGGTQWSMPSGSGGHTFRGRIPQGLQCDSCTLQWRWWTNVGTGEMFRNCADIRVLGSGSPGPSPMPSPMPPATTMRTTTRAPAPAGSCVRNSDCVANAWCNEAAFEWWCPQQGSAGQCPSPQCTREAGGSTTAAPTPAATTTMPPTAAPTPAPTTTRTTAAPATTAMPPTPAPPASIRSGDRVMLKVPRSGHRITVQADGQVHAQWSDRGSWQQLVVEKLAGAGGCPSPEVICHGDTVLLTGWTNNTLTVQGSRVHAEWDHRGEWQQLVVESEAGQGAVVPGSVVFLRAHTGARVDADAPDSPGVVQARWAHQGEWQKLLVERSAAAPEPEPEPEPAPTPAADPRCETCIGHSACIWSDDTCHPAMARGPCEQMGKVFCGDTTGAQAPAPTPAADPRCETCIGHSACIWSDDVCYPAVARDPCEQLGKVFCGDTTSLAQVGAQPREAPAMRKKAVAHRFLALLQAGVSTGTVPAGAEL